MTNAEKFKEVFPNVEVNESQKGFVVLHFKTKFNGYEYEESLAVWNSTWLADYQGEPTISLEEPQLSSSFELGYEHGKADNNDKWLEWIEELESEIEGESQVEEIFDEDSFNSMNNENNLPEVAECESYIETDIIPLHKLFAIIERKLKEIGGRSMTREEAIDKVLDEIQEDSLNVSLPLMEKMTLFAKTQNAVRYVADLPTVEAVPLSVIEKIHDAIDNAECDARLEDENGSFTEEVFTREHITEIIDKAVKEIEKDANM